MPSAGGQFARVGGHGGIVAIDFGYIVRGLGRFNRSLRQQARHATPYRAPSHP